MFENVFLFFLKLWQQCSEMCETTKQYQYTDITTESSATGESTEANETGESSETCELKRVKTCEE